MAARPSSTHTEAPARSPYHGRRMTLAAFEALPEQRPYLQWWDGVVVQKAVPRIPHGIVQLYLAAVLDQYARAMNAHAATEVHIWFEGHGYLVPDLVYWAPGRPLAEGDRALPPSLAIEIRSPRESAASQREKCRDMRANGVAVCWLIDPAARSAECFDATRDGEPAGPLLQAAEFPGLVVDLELLWSRLPAS
ncbi:MAG: Uma2 family endonuclease [Dehalococcoidia bacterium]|nr:Uma2 family endonuclease [Dehalococcoidia bacterium]